MFTWILKYRVYNKKRKKKRSARKLAIKTSFYKKVESFFQRP